MTIMTEINTMKIRFVSLAMFCLFFFLVPPAFSLAQLEIPVKGMVTMVDLGAKKCIPCKMMAPILEKLTRQYEGQAAIIFIDVWEENSQGLKFGVRSIPTQIFYDIGGTEVYRHQGFLAEEAIIEQLAKMGVTAPKGD